MIEYGDEEEDYSDGDLIVSDDLHRFVYFGDGYDDVDLLDEEEEEDMSEIISDNETEVIPRASPNGNVELRHIEINTNPSISILPLHLQTNNQTNSRNEQPFPPPPPLNLPHPIRRTEINHPLPPQN